MAAKMQDEEENPMAQLMYREWAKFLAARQKYDRAIEYFKKSMEYNDDDNKISTLVGLSEAYKKSGHFRQAAEAAHECIEIDPTHYTAEYTRVEALFCIAEFGGSLVHAHRAVQRGNANKFGPMVQLNQETVEDCVGRNVPEDMLRRLLPWMKNLFAHREWLFERLKDEPDEFAGIDEDPTKFKVDDPVAITEHKHKQLDMMVARLGLGDSCEEKFFMQSMASNPALKSANKDGSIELEEIVKNCLERLQRQQEVLWTRKPMYSIKAQMDFIMKKAPALKRAKFREFLLKRCLASRTARYLLRRTHYARLARDYPLFFRWAELTKESIEAYPPGMLPERHIFLDVLYLMIARAYMDPRNLLRFGDDEKKKSAWLQRAMGFKTVKLPHDSDVAWIPTSNLRVDFKKCRERLSLTNRPLEIMWLYHKLCKNFIETHNYGMARFYSKKVRDIAEELGFEEWILHGHHIILRIEVAQQNRTETKEAAEMCLESAKKLRVRHLVDFYERAIDFVKKSWPFDMAEEDSIGKRKKLISSLVPSDFRPKMDLLMNSLDAISARRRLSIMPGCKPPKNQGTKSTIRPQPPFNYKKEAVKMLLKKFSPDKSIPGITNFDKYD